MSNTDRFIHYQTSLRKRDKMIEHNTQQLQLLLEK